MGKKGLVLNVAAKKDKKSVKHRDGRKKNLSNFGGNLRPPWQPGESGNPKGVPRAKINLFRYICQYLEMTPEQLKKLKQDKLTMSQRTALKTVMKMADEGEWQRTEKLIDRELLAEGESSEISKLVIEYVNAKH